MHLIVYGDFNCPYSYLASQRVDAVVRAGRAEVEWRAVEHDRRLALTGTRSSSDPKRWQRELAEVAALAGPGEQVPGAAPALVSNTGAAVAACVEAVTDGVQDELRRSLFSEIWVRLRHVGGPSEVRQLVRALMYPAGPPGQPPPGHWWRQGWDRFLTRLCRGGRRHGRRHSAAGGQRVVIGSLVWARDLIPASRGRHSADSALSPVV